MFVHLGPYSELTAKSSSKGTSTVYLQKEGFSYSFSLIIILLANAGSEAVLNLFTLQKCHFTSSKLPEFYYIENCPSWQALALKLE